MSANTVIRVDEKEFELSNGEIYPHAVPLDHVPTVEEFQDAYDEMSRMFKRAGLLDEATRLNR